MVKTSIHFLWVLVSTAFLLLACNGGIGGGGADPLDSSRAWGASGPTFTVTYVSNVDTDGNPYSGSMPTDDGSYYQGQQVTAKGLGSFVYSGFTFTGWNTQADGSGTAVAAGGAFSMGSGNMSLYAQWTRTIYSVIYHGNGSDGGTVPLDGTAYWWEGTVTVLGNTGNLVNGEETFVGWNTAADGSGTTWQVGQSFTLMANVDLYAIWTSGPTFTVTYNLNDNTGTVPVDSNRYMPGQTVTVLPGRNIPAWSAWNTQSNGGGTTYWAAPTYLTTFTMGSSNVILYVLNL